MADKSATTEVTITGDNDTLAAILQNQYEKLEAGEVRAALEATYKQVWNNEEFNKKFEVTHINLPYVHVVDRQSGQHGTVLCLDSPRFYFLFNPEAAHE